MKAIAESRQVPIPVFAEMGSNNPFIITAGAITDDMEGFANGLANSVTGSGGQLCTKPGVAFVPEGEAGENLIDAFRSRLDAMEPSLLLNSSVHGRFRTGLARLSADRVTERDELERLAGYRQRPVAARVSVGDLALDPSLLEELFGPFVLIVSYADLDELESALEALPGQLTATLRVGSNDELICERLAAVLQRIAGRVLFDGFPTGVAVTWAMHHGGPYPATTDPAHTSVGMTATRRFQRPVTWQSAPQHVLPPQLRDGNPCQISRRVNGVLTTSKLLPRSPNEDLSILNP